MPGGHTLKRDHMHASVMHAGLALYGRTLTCMPALQAVTVLADALRGTGSALLAEE